MLVISAPDPEIAGSTNDRAVLAEDPARAAKGEDGHFEPLGAQPVCVGRAIVPSEDKNKLPRWVEALFAVMQRNSAHVSDYFKLPRDAVVEIGREVAI